MPLKNVFSRHQSCLQFYELERGRPQVMYNLVAPMLDSEMLESGAYEQPKIIFRLLRISDK